VGDGYPELNDVIGISVCDFELWPAKEGHAVPMRSRWRFQEQASGTVGLSSLQLVFLELPKLSLSVEPRSLVDKWAYFFREAKNLDVIPAGLQHPPVLEALEAARTAHFSAAEWDAYIAAGMAIQNERGALSLARREGREEGRQAGREEGREEGLREGLRQAIRDLADVLGLAISEAQESALAALDAAELTALRERLKRERRF